jgi:O-6-methylguanine DNA methyltransferase
MITSNISRITSKQALKNLNAQFSEYVKGKRKKFDLRKIGVHADLRELVGTALQKSVWLELMNIPYGEVISYKEFAKRVGNPKAVRAVASAVGDNPLCIVIPCHRVLPKGSVARLRSSLRNKNNLKTKTKINVGGYALGAGIKEALLKIEGVI